jgi:hypothetical protein
MAYVVEAMLNRTVGKIDGKVWPNEAGFRSSDWR